MTEKRVIIFLKSIINLLISILFTMVFVIVISLIIQKFILKEQVPNILGYKILQVMSGSMSGEFEVGDTILIKEVKNDSDLKIGNVVTYKVAPNTLVTHRIVDITKIDENLTYTMKGDSNNTVDSEKVNFSDIEGMYIKKLKITGKLINFMQQKYGMIIIFTIPIISVIFVINDEKNKAEKRNKRREKRLNYELNKTRENLKGKEELK